MEKSGSKIHKLGSTSDRIVPAETDAAQESVGRAHEEMVRYVAVPQYDPNVLADDDAIDLLELCVDRVSLSKGIVECCAVRITAVDWDRHVNATYVQSVIDCCSCC